MGNALTFLFGEKTEDSDSIGPHGVSAATNVPVSALAHDLFHFEITSQVPEGLSQHVVSSKIAQANWYSKILEAWKEAKPPPKTPEDAARLVFQTLKRHKNADVVGLLAFYGLALPDALVQVSSGVPTSLPEGVLFEMQTLPVDINAVADGDTITVYVRTDDPRESSSVPGEVQMAAVERAEAFATRNYDRADALHNKIIEAGYRVIKIQNEEILAKKYRITLRGIDAPESQMSYGKEAQEELAKIVQGRSLRIFVYGQDRYGRCVGDIYCNGLFVQELMLKKGCAWHYADYDQRWELASWENEARSTSGVPTSLPEGVLFEMQTLPVDRKAVADGDTITVYVRTGDPRESSSVPGEVQMAAVERAEARATRNYDRADALHKKIIEAGYRVIKIQNEEVLAKKYRIRLRGIDAPESQMPYGKEAQEELAKIVQGRSLRIFVYGQDRYGRCVGDIYCNGLFVQELMLKKGCAWHYAHYDQRWELASWENEARSKRVGLWASRNPEEPWEWRKNKREAGSICNLLMQNPEEPWEWRKNKREAGSICNLLMQNPEELWEWRNNKREAGSICNLLMQNPKEPWE